MAEKENEENNDEENNDVEENSDEEVEQQVEEVEREQAPGNEHAQVEDAIAVGTKRAADPFIMNLRKRPRKE